MVTIQEIGRALNLSHTTVSKVLNGRNDQFISEATRQRVRQAAAQMGYRPNRAARSLVTGRTHQIALWIRHLDRAYDARVVSGLLHQIEKSGYQVVIRSVEPLLSGNSSGIDQNTLLEGLWNVDGCIVFEAMSPQLLPQSRPDDLRHRPVIGTGGASFSTPQLPDLDYVGVDLRGGAEDALRHLLDIGCRRIAFVGPYTRTWEEPRSRAYDAIMTEAGHNLEIITTTEMTRAHARSVVRAYIEENGCPDGLLCFNDDVAIGAYRAARDLNLDIPNDVAIVGHDGIEDTEFLDTPLTTLVQPVEEMCALVWTHLRARIEAPSLPPQQTLLRSTLRVRESTQRRR